MTDSIEQQIQTIKQLTLSAAQYSRDDEIASCQQVLTQRQQLLIELDQSIKASIAHAENSSMVNDYAELVSWILATDQSAMRQLDEQKSVILQKGVKQSKTKYALKQYHTNYR